MRLLNRMARRRHHLLRPLVCWLLLPACMAAATPTRINIGDHVLRRNVKRFGINLSGQTFYDSGLMLRNLVARNPGFEGETWQSLIHCAHLTRTACTADTSTAWPEGFMDGAAFELATGPDAGTRGVVRTSTPSLFTFAAPLPRRPGNGTTLILRVSKPANPLAGWWSDFACGSSAAAELHDLPTDSASHQALRVDAARGCQRAAILSYFDSTAGHSFVRLNGGMTLRFRAKPISGRASLAIHVDRSGEPAFLDRAVALAAGWHAYTVPFHAQDRPGQTGTVTLKFQVEGATLLLDDVSLTADEAAPNSTAFRGAVVAALRDLHPGILRFMDNGTSFGTSLDDWLAPPNGRPRTDYSTNVTQQEDISIGLQEVLQLAEAVGAEPWISLPIGLSPAEARNLIEYLAGTPQTRYGGIRAVRGHAEPWTQVFPTVHLELGNEAWNRGSFAGATIEDAAAYGERAATIFKAMRAAPGFQTARFDLVAGSWAEQPSHTADEARALQGAADSLGVAPYLFNHFEAAPGMEAVYGPMLAQPEQFARAGGQMGQQAAVARVTASKLAVYEVNLGTLNGSPVITQAAIDRTVPTMGAALATADHMLLMLRELGMTDQCFFALPEFANGFRSPGDAGPPRDAPLYGAVVDMGGLTGRRRPSYYALRLLNHTLLANEIEASMDGANPTWNQPLSANDHIVLPNAHLLQSFAFGEGKRRSALVLNLSRTQTLPITFAGSNAPRGMVQQTTLTATHIEDSNELADNVLPKTVNLNRFDSAAEHLLPPFSLTAYTWTLP